MADEHIEVWRWWMPPSVWRKREHLSTMHMTAEEARQAGALRPEPSTRATRLVGPAGDLSHLGQSVKPGRP